MTTSLKQGWKHRAGAVVSGIAASVLVFALAGCGQTTADSTTSQDSSSSSEQSQDSSGDSSSDSNDSTSGDSQDSTAKDNASASSTSCPTSQLKVTLSAGQGGGAGSAYPYLVFTNTGTSACTTEGFPGVSLQSSGKQIGAAATRDKTVAAKSITLQPGESAHAVLKITQAGAFSESVCSPKQADSLLVYPPDQLDAIRVKTSDYTGCANSKTAILSVRVLEAGKA